MEAQIAGLALARAVAHLEALAVKSELFKLEAVAALRVDRKPRGRGAELQTPCLPLARLLLLFSVR